MVNILHKTSGVSFQLAFLIEIPQPFTGRNEFENLQ